MRRVLARRDARLYLAGQALSLLGDTVAVAGARHLGQEADRLERRGGPGVLRVVAPQLALAARRRCWSTASAAARC